MSKLQDWKDWAAKSYGDAGTLRSRLEVHYPEALDDEQVADSLASLQVFLSELVCHLLSGETPPRPLGNGELTEEEWPRFFGYLNRVHSQLFYADDWQAQDKIFKSQLENWDAQTLLGEMGSVFTSVSKEMGLPTPEEETM